MIRLKNLDLPVESHRRFVAIRNSFVAGTAVSALFASPVDCIINSIDVYFDGAFSANTSDTLQFKVFAMNNSGTVLGSITMNTSAATNAYAAGQKVSIPITGNNSLTAGFAINIQVSCVCQAVPSQTVVLLGYTPLIHRNTR